MFDFLKKRASDSLDIKAAYACGHNDKRLTKYTCSNGAIQYVMQCRECGSKVGSPIKHAALTTHQRNTAPAFDETTRTARRAEIDHAYALHRERFNSTAWWRAYNAYLISNAWIDKRAQAMNRDNWTCQERRHGCTCDATEVHHLSYTHVGDEPLDDLLSVCHHCHELITAESRRTWRTL